MTDTTQSSMDDKELIAGLVADFTPATLARMYLVAQRNSKRTPSSTKPLEHLKLEGGISRDVAALVDWQEILREKRFGDVYRVLLDESERLRKALENAQREAYLATLDGDEEQDPLEACLAVIDVCKEALG